MTSSLAWLDTSPDEQRRVREMLHLFMQPESRDELGIGQIRDAFSDALFPGTSTLQTRAKYFLLVPWAYLDAEGKGWSPEQVRSHARVVQKRLVPAIESSADALGLIGVRARDAVSQLPSDVYWNGLATFGILRSRGPAGQVSSPASVDHEADELHQRTLSPWHPTIPPAPTGFSNAPLPDGLALTPAEASWLRERILESAPGTLLTHLIATDRAPDGDSATPWHDSVCQTVDGPARGILLHAQRFSLAMEGASRLYNLLVGEAYEAAGFDRVESPVEKQSTAYQGWVEASGADAHALRSWDLDDFWELALRLNGRISHRTRFFVTDWVTSIQRGAHRTALTDELLRSMVANRERSLKKTQSRLTNAKLLGQWTGAAGLGRLTYRWTTVRRIVTDVHDGMHEQ